MLSRILQSPSHPYSPEEFRLLRFFLNWENSVVLPNLRPCALIPAGTKQVPTGGSHPNYRPCAQHHYQADPAGRKSQTRDPEDCAEALCLPVLRAPNRAPLSSPSAPAGHVP